MSTPSSGECNRSASRTACWAYSSAPRSRVKRDRPPPRHCGVLGEGLQPSASRARSRTTARSARPREPGEQAACARRPNASRSSLVTNPSPPPRVPSGSRRAPTVRAGAPPRDLNGLGKDAAQIISRLNGFTQVQTRSTTHRQAHDRMGKGVFEVSVGRSRCYGADRRREGVAILHHEGVDVSITGNSTNPTRFPASARRDVQEGVRPAGQALLSVASGGGTGSHPAPRQHGRKVRVLRYEPTPWPMHSMRSSPGSSSGYRARGR